MTFGLGIAAALTSPLVMTIGFIMWEDYWKGSAFSLNLFKCSTASIGFFIVSIAIRGRNNLFPEDIFTKESVGFLILSAIIGIVIGDVIWLQALQLIGARRVILMDSLKPFLAALLGWWLLDENLVPAAIGGIALTVIGVLVVSLEKEQSQNEGSSLNGSEQKSSGKMTHESLHATEDPCLDDCRSSASTSTHEKATDGNPSDDATDNAMQTIDSQALNKRAMIESDDSHAAASNRMRLGYILSLLNAIFDTFGALLIKQYGVEMNVWEINFIRFGSSALILLCISFLMWIGLMIVSPAGDEEVKHNASSSEINRPSNDETEIPVENTPWHALPIHEMTSKAWLHVSGGVLLVTFFAPALTNYALLQIALALTLTLSSVGPIYALPLSFVMQTRQFPSTRAVCGTMLAVSGIVVLAFRGGVPEN